MESNRLGCLTMRYREMKSEWSTCIRGLSEIGNENRHMEIVGSCCRRHSKKQWIISV